MKYQAFWKIQKYKDSVKGLGKKIRDDEGSELLGFDHDGNLSQLHFKKIGSHQINMIALLKDPFP